MRRSRILDKIARGDVALICNTSFTYSWRVTEMVGAMGFDGVWVDMEHRDFGYQEAATMILAARAVDMDAVVRIRKDSYADYFRPLEDGAAGIMVPHIKTAAEAQFAVYNSRYAPVGRRGMDGVGADTLYGLDGSSLEDVNRETFCMAQLEDFEAIENLEAIVATEGLAGVLVGPADLSQSYGRPGELDCPQVIAALEAVAEVCAAHGKWWGAPGINPEFTGWLVDRGAQFLAIGSDYACLRDSYQKQYDEATALLRSLGR